jgi:hypothetical protein
MSGLLSGPDTLRVGQGPEKGFEQQFFVRISLERFDRVVDAVDRIRASLDIGRATVDGGLAVCAGERGKTAAKFVGAMAPKLTLVSFLELLLPASPFAVCLDALIQLGDLGFVTGDQRLGSSVNQVEKTGGSLHCDCAGAIQLVWGFGECCSPFGERRVGG